MRLPVRPLAGWLWERRRAACAGWRSPATSAEAEASLRAEFPLADAAARSVAFDAGGCGAVARFREDWPRPKRLPHRRCPAGSARNRLSTARVAGAARRFRAARRAPIASWRARWAIPRPTRAVARACAMNRVSLLVPCHRVVGAGGSLTGYRWGVERKRQLLEAERAPS